jgi:hypothetical protein
MKKLNYWHLAAAMSCAAMLGMHVFVGGPQLNAPIQNSGLPDGIRAVSEVAWHSVTAAFALMAAALAYLAAVPNKGIAKYIVAQLCLLSMLFVSYSISRFGNVTTMYLWPFFLIIAAIIGMGLARSRSYVN